ncbi:MAG: hypothetical protein JW929_07955 [Anaerolineales bacterium]|nr:hypothetical protein [Anaerolineales bacterium]
MFIPRRHRRRRLWLIPVLACLLGCRAAAAAGDSLPATQTALAHSIFQYSTSAGGRFLSATAASPDIRADTPTESLSLPPAETAAPSGTPSPSPTPTHAHTTTPPAGSGATRYIVDPDTRDYAPQQRVASGSDEYQHNRWERPYTSGTMDYLPDVDLVRAELRIDPPWIVVTFFASGTRAEGIGRTMYGAEFDTDLDGRGDYLIWGASPSGVEWTVEGVEVWTDFDGDVGGPSPQMTNAPWTGGTGYDQNLFRGGQGADPDLAWIRRVEGGAKVQLGFKSLAIKNAAHFLWNGLADFGVRRPDWMDYNDRFTQGEAGSPLPIQPDYYPLAALFGIDNTCRDAYGYAPTGAEVGLC